MKSDENVQKSYKKKNTSKSLILMKTSPILMKFSQKSSKFYQEFDFHNDLGPNPQNKG